jgi:hypothetical protein
VLAKEIEGTAFLSRLTAFSDDPPGFGGQFSVQKEQLAVFIHLSFHDSKTEAKQDKRGDESFIKRSHTAGKY